MATATLEDGARGIHADRPQHQIGVQIRSRLAALMTQRQLIARDSKRDLGAELLQAARQMKLFWQPGSREET